MRNVGLTGSILLILLVLALLVSPLSPAVTSLAADPTPTPTPGVTGPMPPIIGPTPTVPPGRPYVQLPLSTDWGKTADSPQAKAKASIELPGPGFQVDWNELSKVGNTYIAEVRIWELPVMAPVAGASISSPVAGSVFYTKEYDLGDVLTGQYLFILRAWGKVIGAEIISFVSPSGTPTPTPSPTPRPTITPIGTPIPLPPVVLATGTLIRLISTSFTYGTHGLTRDGQLVMALQSQKVDLDQYVGKDVIVWGNPMAVPVNGGPPLLNVLGIAVKPVPTVPPPTPRPTITPTPRPTVTPTPTPRPTPFPRGTGVYVGSATLAVGKGARLPVVVKNVTATAGLGAYDFRVSYNPAVIRVDDVIGGKAPFGAIAAKNIDNAAGQVAFNGFQAAQTGPRGDVLVAYLAVTAVATTWSTTPINTTIVTLVDTTGANIAATAVRSYVSVLPSPAVASVRLAPGVGQDGRAVINVIVDKLRNASTNSDMNLANAIKRFSGQADFNPDRISIASVQGVGAFASPTSDVQNDAGGASFGGVPSGATGNGPVVLAQLVPKITGTSTDTQIINVSLDALEDGNGSVALDGVPGMSLKRGDARADGIINISDALFIAQFLAGSRQGGDGLDQVHIVNGASAKSDGDLGDKLDITDALFIAQYLAGLRDDSFNLAP